MSNKPEDSFAPSASKEVTEIVDEDRIVDKKDTPKPKEAPKPAPKPAEAPKPKEAPKPAPKPVEAPKEAPKKITMGAPASNPMLLLRKRVFFSR